MTILADVNIENRKFMVETKIEKHIVTFSCDLDLHFSLFQVFQSSVVNVFASLLSEGDVLFIDITGAG